jgi:hypothetical protein
MCCAGRNKKTPREAEVLGNLLTNYLNDNGTSSSLIKELKDKSDYLSAIYKDRVK